MAGISCRRPAEELPAGAWIFRAGDHTSDTILVESGHVEIVRPSTSDTGEAVVASYGTRQFSGELNILTQQSAYLDARAATASVIHRIGPTAFRKLMDEDPELSDIVLRALLARHRNLRAGEATQSLEIHGSDLSASTFALRTYAGRLQLPHTWTDSDSLAGEALARAVEVGTATGARCRSLPLERWHDFEGASLALVPA